MRRSWLALSAVIAVIAAVIIVQAWPRPQASQPSEEPKPKTATVAVAPATETPPENAQETGKQETEPAKPKTEEPAKAPGPPPEPQTTEAVLEKAEALVTAGKVAEAQKTLSDALTKDPKPANLDPIKARLTRLNDEALFSPKPSPLATAYKVESGDFLGKIAGKFKTTIGLIKRINAIEGDTIRIDQPLKIIPGGFDVEVVKSQFKLTVFKDGTWIRELKVGLGKDGSTPVGDFKAGPKLVKPAYTAVFPHIPYGDQKNNPLGTRWITIEGPGGNQYGIHGTWEPESIGKEASKGCVRMLNEEVEWLFDLIVPGESKIAVKP